MTEPYVIPRPARHGAAGLYLSRQVVPRDGTGNASPGGRIELLTIGMSNTRAESDAFVTASLADPLRNPAVIPVRVPREEPPRASLPIRPIRTGDAC